MPYALHVFVIHVRDHGNRWRQLQERAVAFVRFRYHVVAFAEPRIAAESAQTPADDRRRIESCALEQQRDHRGRRGFAVCAGDCDPVAQPHQLGKHLGPRDHRDRACPGLGNLRIPFANGRRHDHDVCPSHVRRLVAEADPDAERLESIGHVRRLEVGPADVVSEIREELGDAAHPDTSDPDEVNPPRAPEHQIALFASSKTRSTMAGGRIRMREPVRGIRHRAPRRPV